MTIYPSQIGTLAAKINNDDDLENENIVKVITNKGLKDDGFSRAENFLRNCIKQDNIYHHIGIYCYSAETLERFVKLEQSQNEIKSRLEQLRALDNNIEINVSLAKSSPIGVDTEEDYLALKKIMEYKS
jgi:3-deoxy-manno-octulosonate cytidylyltransferase (CMP-KDO synthetase)